MYRLFVVHEARKCIAKFHLQSLQTVCNHLLFVKFVSSSQLFLQTIVRTPSNGMYLRPSSVPVVTFDEESYIFFEGEVGELCVTLNSSVSEQHSVLFFFVIRAETASGTSWVCRRQSTNWYRRDWLLNACAYIPTARKWGLIIQDALMKLVVVKVGMASSFRPMIAKKCCIVW